MYKRIFLCSCGLSSESVDYPNFPVCGCGIVQTIKNLKHCISSPDGKKDNTVRSGDFTEFYSLELGTVGKAAQAEYRKNHPGAEFNKYGALRITSSKQIRDIQKERGVVNLNESSEYREEQKDLQERARAGEFNQEIQGSLS